MSLKIALNNFFLSPHGLGRLFFHALYIAYHEGKRRFDKGPFGSEKQGVDFYGALWTMKAIFGSQYKGEAGSGNGSLLCVQSHCISLVELQRRNSNLKNIIRKKGTE
jgi:hypothetical protein